MADNHINIEAERREFEEWAAGKHPEAHATLREDGEYQHGGMRDWWPCWLARAAARRPATDGAALDLPPLPKRSALTLTMPNEKGVVEVLWEAPEYSTDKTSLYTWAQVEQIRRDAVEHYQRKQGGEPRTYMTDEQAEKWAWDQVRRDVGTEGWTAGDSCNYYGFFLWGWRYRAQYERQRGVGQSGKQPTKVES